MTQEKRTDVNTLGEFGLIEHLIANKALKHPSSFFGIGDDAAVLDYGGDPIVVSTDLLVEGIHFDLIYTPLKHLGYKSVVVNLSDICAMNAIPKQITVSLAISNRFSVEALEELYEGIHRACEVYGVDLIGGDTTSCPKGITISITAIGTAPKEKIAYRSGAKPGDLICITGDLGAAYLGLQILEREKQLYLDNPNIKPDLENKDYLIGRQLKPEARLDIIETFQKNNIVPTSMIDISDGLASELYHICKSSGVGAFIEEAQVPMNDEMRLMAIKFKLDPITCALSGGEDYELLFTINPEDIEKVQFMSDVYIAGEITESSEGIKLHTTGGNIHPIKSLGWNHFNPNQF
jgi:thiamine-monophosphate kinase